ncbi:hypothetical protein [Sansalvadorimonas verongulae]|uniref:hypothetical protein n=1 Tax=Sansalvadorimonas verongulae TaxID=2172824 RepID=UPI0012BD12C9|nr:hypothetical protein [Sansalvadorimonas verongulae]MTI14201.1 hypothetical protein [Sansalvadorimonas verongulae]
MQSQIHHSTVSINDTLWGVPKAVSGCTVCKNDAASVIICEEGHKICATCFEEDFDKLSTCPECRAKLADRDIARYTKKGGLLTLNNTRFYCMSEKCGWSGGYNELEAHKKLCSQKLLDCDYGCGERTSGQELDRHKQQCRKRPYKEGNLAADYETVMEAKRLRDECLKVEGDPSTTQSNPELTGRLVRLYPLVLNAALKEGSKASQPTSLSVTNIPCHSPCGFIASNLSELSSHFSDCPYISLPCRHCTLLVERRDLSDHEERCDRRPVSCTYCESSLLQGEMTQHFQDCISYPVNCVLCNNDLARSTLKEHQATACPQRSVECDRCFEATTAAELDTHKQGCQFMQKIILPASSANAAVTLVPQPNSTGPVYQPEDCSGDSSVIYLALPHKKFQDVMRRKKRDGDERANTSFFHSRYEITCTYAESPSNITSFVNYHNIWRLGIEQPDETRKHRFVWTNMDVLDTQNQKVAHLVQYYPASGSEGGVKICIGSNFNHSVGHLKTIDEQEAKVLSHEFPSDLMLIRIRHDKNKK